MKTFKQFLEGKNYKEMQPGTEEWFNKWIPKIMELMEVDEEEARILARRCLDYEHRMSPQAIIRTSHKPDMKKVIVPPFKVTAQDVGTHMPSIEHPCEKCGKILVDPSYRFCAKCSVDASEKTWSNDKNDWNYIWGRD